MNYENNNCFKTNYVINLNDKFFEANTLLFIQRPYSRVQWTKEENDIILNHVKKFGPRKWKTVADEIGTKNAQQCRDHYNDVLDPQIKNGIWTKEEEKNLLMKYEQLGPHWARIKAFLPGRTTGMIKNCINVLLRKRRYQNEENKKHFSTELSNKYEERKKVFSYHDIQSLLNHPINYQF